MSDQKVEIQEAINAGESALHALGEVEKSIKSAERFSVWDMLGGGLISTMMKHSRLDEAQRNMDLAKLELQRFNNELCDVNMNYDVTISFEGFTQFADYFFDGLIVDFIVQDKIEKSKTAIRNVIDQVQAALNRLYQMQGQLQ